MNRWKINSQNQQLAFMSTVRDQKTHLLKLRQIKSTLRTTLTQSSVRYQRPSQQSKYFRSSTHSSRVIDQQNNKMFSRLLQVKPTVQTSNPSYLSIINKPYKESLARSRYKHPDYTVQAKKMIRGQKNHLKHLISHRPNQSMNNLSINGKFIARRKNFIQFNKFSFNPNNQLMMNKKFHCIKLR